MNVSKRTWILLGVAILAILAAFASLYFEKEEEIKTLEAIEPQQEKTVRTKAKKAEEVVKETILNESESNGPEQTV